MTLLPPDALSPERLAQAVAQALSLQPPEAPLDSGGARATARILLEGS